MRVLAEATVQPFEPPTLLVLAVYCLLLLAASLLGGWLPIVVKLTHRRLEMVLSFVAGVMLGLAVLHLLPHAIMERGAALGETALGAHEVTGPICVWMLAGFMVMFVVERFFCYHHHDAPPQPRGKGEGGEAGSAHSHHHHSMGWAGAAIGLVIHSLIEGVALAAAVSVHAGYGHGHDHGHDHAAEGLAAAAGAGAAGGGWLVGLGTFLIIVLHKPFDALTIGTLMAAGEQPLRRRHLVNVLFALVIPVGAALMLLGVGEPSPQRGLVVSAALAFACGTFLCIALSDLLPELQFHQHDRIKLTTALLAGLALAWAIARLEAQAH